MYSYAVWEHPQHLIIKTDGELEGVCVFNKGLPDFDQLLKFIKIFNFLYLYEVKGIQLVHVGGEEPFQLTWNELSCTLELWLYCI